MDEQTIAERLFGATAPAQPAPATLATRDQPAPDPAPSSAPQRSPTGRELTLAERMFGHDPALDHEPPPPDTRPLEERLFGDPEPLPEPTEVQDDEIVALRADPTRSFFKGDLDQVLPVKLADEVARQGGLDAGHVRQFISDARAWASDLNATGDELRQIGASLETAQELAERGEEAVHEARVRATSGVFREHGDREGELALRAAHAFVAKQPTLRAMLEATGLGDDPTTVRVIARRALALHKAGRLSIPPLAAGGKRVE
jgi:hypothetical protein